MHWSNVWTICQTLHAYATYPFFHAKDHMAVKKACPILQALADGHMYRPLSVTQKVTGDTHQQQ